jgi:GGDEF domain-containing protein
VNPVGGQALKIFAERLGAVVRPTDVIARLGGDECARCALERA